MKKILRATLKIKGFGIRLTSSTGFFPPMKLVHGAIFLFIMGLLPVTGWAQAAASSNYDTQTGTLGSTYSWIDCSGGTEIVSGDDSQTSFYWPFDFNFYDNTYTTANLLSVATNGFIRLDETASTNYSTASNYTLSSASTEFGQIIALAVYDGKVGDGGGWVRGIVTGSSPNRIMTIEYNNLEIDYNDGRYTDVQVSFYETSNKVVLKLGADNINKNGVDMGIHSGVDNYFDKWQEVYSGTNNTWIEYTPVAPPNPPSPPAASWNYGFSSGSLGTTYNWIDCSAGNFVVSGDDVQAQIPWPFDFNYYDNSYTTSNSLSVSSNGFIRLDGLASTDYITAMDYDLTSAAINLGQIIAMALYDGNVSTSPWVRSLVTGTAPNRVFTIEYSNYEIDYNDGLYANVQVSFYESTNKIILKLGADNINKSGVDMGLHSGVNTYFNKWQEVLSGTNNTWIEYIPPYVEVNATIGSSSASYFTLKSAFDKINDGTHQGEITIKINHSTTEPSAAVLYSSSSGSANYSSVNIYPTETGLSISGDLPTPLIDLNGADHVTIDGRLNATGTTKDLTINNTSTSSTAGTSTVRFINDAKNNTVKYCTIKGSESSAASGIFFFSTTTSSNGSDGNTISNNNITSSVSANRPVNAIYSLGTPGKDNSGNSISTNNIYDFLNPGTASNGILLSSNTTEWTIDGNNFYETASFNPTASVTYNAILISNTSGYGFIISNNYIGGNLALCQGTAWTKTNATNNLFTAIYLDVSSTTASSVQNNTIQNFNWSNSGSADWVGINIGSGKVDIGTVSGNKIGATTGTNSISVTGGLNGQSIYGIKLSGTGVLNCYNNFIGSLTGIAASGLATHLYGIYLSGSAVTTIEDNIIGSTTTGSSIYASSASTANAQKVYGIYSMSSGSTIIHQNTIANLKNNTSNTSAGTAGLINGIYISSGTNTVFENTISDISISNANTILTTPSAVGMFLSTGTGVQSIHDNLIYNVSNTYSSYTGAVVGLYISNSLGAGAGDVNANFIHSLSVTGTSAGAKIYGLYENTDKITYSNNIISLGGNTSTTIYGVYDVGSSEKAVDLFFNSIYLSGTNSGAENSYALWYNTNSNTRDIRNNILFNARSGGAGSHYAIYYNATGGTFTADYNDYFVTGTGGVLSYYGGGQSTLALLQTATSQDANSLNANPLFATAGGTNSSDYATITTLTGIGGTGITLDYDKVTRNDPPKMGALEVSVTFIWQGNTGTGFATATNWDGGTVPPNGADIEFAASPANDCYLDQARTLKNITNTSDKKFYVNGKQFTLTGNIASATLNQIDATTASSVVIFAGSSAQNIPDGVFASNTIDALTLNNNHGLTQNGDLIVSTKFTLTTGNYSIGANTLTLNGDITTATGTITGGSSSNIAIGGSGATATLPGVTINNLTLNRSNGISLGGDVTVTGTLNLTDGILTIGANTLTISGNSPTRVSGQIDASNSSATIAFTNSSAITLTALLFTGNINNLTINSAGITAGSDLTVNEVLNLQGANPSATKGSLDMSTYTLNMSEFATTIGMGDVTGIIKRQHTFIGNIQYSFGNENTTLTFINTGTKPGWVSCKVSIGADPDWRSTAVKRVYSFAKDAGDDRVKISLHYLDTELDPTETDETKLVFWDAHNGPIWDLVEPHGKSNNNATDNWVELTGMSIGYLAPSGTLDFKQWGLGFSTIARIIWTGLEYNGDWSSAGNWNGGVPTSDDDVLIPAGLTSTYPTNNSLSGTQPAVAKSIEIEAGASVTVDSYDITIYGKTGAWINNGTFIPGNGNVIFSNGTITNIVSIGGTTNFNNLTINDNTYIQPVTGSVVRIAGTLTAGSSSILDFVATGNTIEYSGGSQTVLNPIGPGTDTGYYKLILSGSGTKTMPVTALHIADELKLMGTVTATAASEITIGNELEILENATFATGNFDHTVGGPFDNRGAFIASSGTNITLNGTAVQEIYGGSPTTFEKLTINNAAGVDIITDITVNEELKLTSGNLNILNTTLTINGTITKTSGFINTATLSSLTFGGTTALITATDLFVSTPQINNLTINRTGGVEFCCDFTVDGILHLQSANPLSTKGCLDMGTDTLTMGDASTTTGIGDVTGIVKRKHTFVKNVEYSFGSQYTTFTFNDDNLKPTWISLKIAIGSVASWTPWSLSPDGKVKRLYQLASSENASTSAATINMRYLLSELDATYNDESKLVFWHKLSTYASGEPHEHGKSTQDFTNHFIGVTGLILSATTTYDLTDSQVTIAYPVSAKNTWKGEVSGYETEWEQAQNWTGGHVPLSTEDILIPGMLTYYPSLTASSNAVAKTIEIHSGASISANSYDITVSGSGGAWINNGTFNAGTGKVLFNHGVSEEVVTVSGITNFYNIEIGANTTLQPIAGSIFRIAGAATGNPPTSKANWSLVNSTVEWNGVNQNINNPQGIGGNTGFYNLVLSGSGTKTMPSSALTVHGDFTISGTASATAADSIIVLGNTTIDNGATFTTGSHQHFLSGNFENNGTFTSTSGGTITFNGSSAQTISGSSTTTLDGLSIKNLQGASMSSDVNVNNVLSFLDGTLTVGSNTLEINGTIYNPSGNIEVSSASSLSFGGTTAITLNNNLFNGHPVINNLTLNRSGGVTLGNESITVNGTLSLTSGTLAIAANTLTLSGNSPVRASGNIDVSHAVATLAFENTAAIALPPSLFSGNVNNMTIIGAGGITSGGDFTLVGILNLQSANPSSVKGSLDMSSYILTMGGNATTIGQGDVSGIIKRTSIASNTTYTMGNQYTTIYFPNVGTLPTEMSLKVTLGSFPSWRTGAVERVYDFIQTGGSGTEALLQSHYLDSELNGNNETKLVEWMHIYAYPLTIEYGRSNYNTNENWVSVSHVNVGVYASVFGAIEMIVDEYELQDLTWNGSTSTSWVTATNWTPQGAPSDETVVTIPDAATTAYDPSIPAIAICGKVIIESGGILNSVSDGQLTVKGTNGAWVNSGTFAPRTGTIIFANSIETDTVTIVGTNNFYNLTVTDKTRFQPDTNSIINIEGAFTANTSNCIVDFSSNPNTVGYNGSKEQSVVNPGGIYGYHNLNFSGDGEKILPKSSLMILGNLNIDAVISATGNTLLMAGANAQNLGGTTAATLNNLTIDNASGVALTNTALTTISGSLLINSAAKLEVTAGQKLSVTGTITNNSGSTGFVLNSDATGTASLIHNTNNVTATVERYISGAAEDWHFLSSPVVGQAISGTWLPSGTYGNGTGYDLYVWDEPSLCWVYQLNTTVVPDWPTVHPSANFVPGRGYLYSVQATNPSKSFAGDLNSGTVLYGLTVDGSTDVNLQGFNLVGNPYPSSMDWMAASGWTRDNLVTNGGGTDMWVWNPEAGNYGVCNSADASGVGTNAVTRYIPSMQGFFVRAVTAGNLQTTDDVRIHDATTLWKSGQIISNRFIAVVYSETDQTFDEVRLLFGYPENKAGAAKLFSPVATAPSLYLPMRDANFTIRYLSDTIANPNVPLMFKAGREGYYTITFDFDSFDFDIAILEDQLTGEFTDLTLDYDYRFSASKSDNENRFIIHFGAVQRKENLELPANIYVSDGALVIDLTLVDELTDVLVVDVLGRIIFQKNLNGNSIHRLNVNARSQIVIVTAKTNKAMLSRKVFVP